MSVKRRGVEFRSTCEASLRAYFLTDYKGGGAFQHHAYEHDPQSWSWMHKKTGIKVGWGNVALLVAWQDTHSFCRGSWFGSWKLLTGLGRCCWPYPITQQWWYRMLLPLHLRAGVSKYHRTQQASCGSFRLGPSCHRMSSYLSQPPWKPLKFSSCA